MEYKKFCDLVISDVNQSRNSKSEMSTAQINFLCSLIEQFSPTKIVEVGVSAGGTSVEIIRHINQIALSCEMYSVDLSEVYYRDPTKQCGYLINEMDLSERKFHSLLTGKILPERLKEIGEEIDFLILDTVHKLPGEILDFLAVLPFLKENAVVVLHDIALHHFGLNNCFATNVLFSVVTADKFLNDMEEVPNIAAFRINEDTKKYILDVFYSLMLPWEYIPDEKQLVVYSNFYSVYYGKEARILWEKACKTAIKSFLTKKTEIQKFWKQILKVKQKFVFIYGAGKTAKFIADILNQFGVQVRGFVISDGQPEQEGYRDIPLYFLSEVSEEYADIFIVMSFISNEVEKILKNRKYEYLPLPFPLLEMMNLI